MAKKKIDIDTLALKQDVARLTRIVTSLIGTVEQAADVFDIIAKHEQTRQVPGILSVCEMQVTHLRRMIFERTCERDNTPYTTLPYVFTTPPAAPEEKPTT